MCCFSQSVKYVHATNIFARSGANGRQWLVYSMEYEAKTDLSMVLPIPVKAGSGENAVEFIDLKEYESFFADLLKGFPMKMDSGGIGCSKSAEKSAAGAKLPVVQVGNFEASYVPTIKDFDRLDERFRLPPGSWSKLPGYRNFGFAVFKLKAGETKVHPMAFSFPRANPAELFFPTVHIHDGLVHEQAFFDHVLYCQRDPADKWRVTDWRESPKLAKTFVKLDSTKGIVTGEQHCFQLRMRGTLKNEDTILRVKA